MEIEFDPAKRMAALAERGLDFADAAAVFATEVITVVDDRFAYGEDRYLSYGFVADRMVAMVWVDRDYARRIISMRHVHEKEMARVRSARS